MRAFMEKYADSFEDKDALKLIKNKLHKAVDYCEEKDPEYLGHLATANDMIEDYFKMKNVILDSTERE